MASFLQLKSISIAIECKVTGIFPFSKSFVNLLRIQIKSPFDSEHFRSKYRIKTNYKSKNDLNLVCEYFLIF